MAVDRYLDDLDADSITEQIDAAIAAESEPDDTNEVAAAYGRQRLAADEQR